MTTTPDPTADMFDGPPPSTEVVRTVGSLDSRIRYAREIATAGTLLPKGVTDGLRPGDAQAIAGRVFLIAETGNMLGIHPVAALQGVHVIEGKPTISPALMSALVRRAGHRVRVRVEGSAGDGSLVAVAQVVRSDDPEFPFESRWDVDRARRAGLWAKKGAWTWYPEAMMKARALSEVCREAAEDCLMGVHYTPEELGAMVEEDGTVVDATLVTEEKAPEPTREHTPEEFATIAFRLAGNLPDLAALEAFIGDELPTRLASYSWARQYPTTNAFATGVEVDTRTGRVPFLEAIARVEKYLRSKGEGEATGGQDGRQCPPQGGGTPADTQAYRPTRAEAEEDPWADGGAQGTPPARREDRPVQDAEVVEDDAPPAAPAQERVPGHREAVGNAAAGLGGTVVDDDTAQGLQEAHAAAERAKAEFERDNPAADQGHAPLDPDGVAPGRAAWEAQKAKLAAEAEKNRGA